MTTSLLALLLCCAPALAVAQEPATLQSASTQRIHPAAASKGLGSVHKQMEAAVLQGEPVVFQVHVPLCDNTVLACGNARLGDGDNPNTNLYWATAGGLRGWFTRRGSPWTKVFEDSGNGTTLRARMVFRRTIDKSVFGKAGTAYLVAYAWSGQHMDAAVTEYLHDLATDEPRTIPVKSAPAGQLLAGGKAHVVAYLGHNRWMDTATDWSKLTFAPDRTKGVIAIACQTDAYLSDHLPVHLVPLVMTRDFLFAGGHALEGALNATLARRPSLTTIRRATATAYQLGQGLTRRVDQAFTNPSDPRWQAAGQSAD